MTTKDETLNPVIYLNCTQETATIQYTAVCSYIRRRTDLFSLSDQDCLDEIPLYIDFISGEQSSAPSCIPNLDTLIQEHASNEYDCVVLFGLSTLPSSWQGEWILSLLIDYHHFRVLSALEGYDSSKEKKPVFAFPSHAMLEPPADYPLNPVVEQVYHNSLLREDTGENANNSAFSAYGYLFDPDIPCMMKPDPATAPVVQKIFQMHLSGILTNQIATYLTKEGIPSPITRRKQMGTTFHYGSSHWSYVSILKILQNRTYIGEHIYRLPKLPKHIRKQALQETPFPSGTVISHHHPALISEGDFEAAQILLKCRPKREVKTSSKKYFSTPFTNAVFCGICGRPMMHRHKHSRSAYICSSTAKHLPDACPYIQYSTDDLVSAAYHAISEERKCAASIKGTINQGTQSEAYLKAAEDIQKGIIEILDQARHLKSLSEDVSSAAFASEPLRDTLSSLVDKKEQLINTFSKENKWLKDFDISDNFELDRSTAKRLIQRIDVFPEKKIMITLRDQEEKKQLLQYL